MLPATYNLNSDASIWSDLMDPAITRTAMIVYQLTLAEFLACPDGPRGGTTASFDMLYPGIDWRRGTEIPIITNPRYATALPNGYGSFSNLVLLDRLPEWRIVGGYIDTNLLIDGEAKGKGLSRELILRTAEHRGIPVKRQ